MTIDIEESAEQILSIAGQYQKAKYPQSSAEAGICIHAIQILQEMQQRMGYETLNSLIEEWMDMDPDGIY